MISSSDEDDTPEGKETAKATSHTSPRKVKGKGKATGQTSPRKGMEKGRETGQTYPRKGMSLLCTMMPTFNKCFIQEAFESLTPVVNPFLLRKQLTPHINVISARLPNVDGQ